MLPLKKFFTHNLAIFQPGHKGNRIPRLIGTDKGKGERAVTLRFTSCMTIGFHIHPITPRGFKAMAHA